MKILYYNSYDDHFCYLITVYLSINPVKEIFQQYMAVQKIDHFVQRKNAETLNTSNLMLLRDKITYLLKKFSFQHQTS